MGRKCHRTGVEQPSGNQGVGRLRTGSFVNTTLTADRQARTNPTFERIDGVGGMARGNISRPFELPSQPPRRNVRHEVKKGDCTAEGALTYVTSINGSIYSSGHGSITSDDR